MKIECVGTLLGAEEHDKIIRRELIPKLLSVIEESGISCHEAATIPTELESAIEMNLLRTMHFTKFKVQADLE